MKRILYYIPTCIFVAAMFASCGSARLVNMWKDPTFHGELNNVLIVGLCDNLGAERTFEDAFAQELEKRGVKATPGYTIFGDRKPETEEELRAVVRDGGFDGFILTTLEGVDTRASYTPGYTTYVPRLYRSYWGNYYVWYDRIRQPGYYRNYKVLRLQTSVWKIGQDERLIWTGTSEVLSPASSDSTRQDVVRLITKELAEERVFA